MAYSPSTRDENEEIISRVAKDVSSRTQLPHRPRLILVSTHGDFFYDCYFLIVTSQLEGKEKQVYWERVKRERETESESSTVDFLRYHPCGIIFNMAVEYLCQ